MKRNAFRNAAALAFSVTLAGAVMAQTPSPQPPQTPPSTTPQTRPAPDTPRQDSLKNMIGQTVTVSGCLASASGSGGTAPAGASSDFVLTNVQLRSGAPTAGATPGATPGSPSTGTPSTSGASGSSNTKIKLKETGTAKLSENVNKRVEVTGKLEAGSSSTAPRPGTTPGAPGTPEPGAPKTSASADAMPELQVASVKVLEQTCTP